MSVESKVDAVHPLGTLKAGEGGVVVHIQGGRRMTARLADLGLLPGTKVRVVSNALAGPLLVEVRNCRYSLGRGISDKVMVQT